MSELKGYLTISEVAARIKVSKQAIWDRIRTGSLKAIYIGDQVSYLVPEKEIMKWKPLKRGRKKGIRMKLLDTD